MLNGSYIFNNQAHTILYYVDRNNPRGAVPSNPAADPQFPNWEWSVQNNFRLVVPEPSPTPIETPSPGTSPMPIGIPFPVLPDMNL